MIILLWAFDKEPAEAEHAKYHAVKLQAEGNFNKA